MQGNLPPIVQEYGQLLYDAIFKVDGIWSIVIRGGIWLGIALVIIISSDRTNPEQSLKSMKANLGFFLMFLILTGGLLFLLFGFTQTPASA